MDAKTAWYLFETTGNIEAYLLYHDTVNGKAKHKTQNTPVGVYSFTNVERTSDKGIQPPFSTTL